MNQGIIDKWYAYDSFTPFLDPPQMVPASMELCIEERAIGLG